MDSPTLQGFPPIVAAGARILILGNMPGVASLHAQQYYAHPRNAFWRITGELFGFDPTAPYDDRVAALGPAGVAVWDVLRSCRRVGSLDSAVERESMVANDFGALLTSHPTITHVGFNGAAAETELPKTRRPRPRSAVLEAAVDEPRAHPAIRGQAGRVALRAH